MTLTSVQPAKLVGASSPAAGVVEVHEMKMENDMMRMRQMRWTCRPASWSSWPRRLSPDAAGAEAAAEGRRQNPADAGIEDAKKVRSKVVVDAPVKPLSAGH
jgi:hypothetical protein